MALNPEEAKRRRQETNRQWHRDHQEKQREYQRQYQKNKRRYLRGGKTSDRLITQRTVFNSSTILHAAPERAAKILNGILNGTFQYVG